MRKAGILSTGTTTSISSSSFVSASMAVRKLERAAQAAFLLELVATTSTSSAPAASAILPSLMSF